MTTGTWLLLLFLLSSEAASSDSGGDGMNRRRTVIDVDGAPGSVVWVVQLSDLHFSVFYPGRALDFKNLVGPALAMIKPSLVLITGDLTDGKSKDLLTMKQNEREWIEYQNVMADVVAKSGLDKKIFYDLRGNHDNFGVLEAGNTYDFYNTYSVNAGAQQTQKVNSITLKLKGWKHLFVGFDSTMDVGLRGPTNLFGHPSDQLLTDIDNELSQWDSDFGFSEVRKISFGHFPLSFSAVSDSGRTLKDVFLKHSLSAYICGHLHSRFGRNLKRHHIRGQQFPSSSELYQLNIHQETVTRNLGGMDCSNKSKQAEEFWEWEMGDWRKRRALRIISIDSGHVSYLDTDFSLGVVKTVIMPTFPLDSHFMQRVSMNHDYTCKSSETSSYETVRALIFSVTEIDTVFVKIYDSKPGKLDLVMHSTMKAYIQNGAKTNLYMVPWNWRAFVDPSPDRYWLQIEAVDIFGRSTVSELRPFSINGLTAKVDWKWKEFLVMGFQLASIYYLLLWIILPFLFCLLLIPQAFLILTDTQTTNRILHLGFSARSMVGFVVTRLCWILLEFSRLTKIWFGILVYLLYLTFFSWFSGNVSTENGHIGYMTCKGWVVKIPNKNTTRYYLGVPDIMVVVIPHLCFVVLPAIVVMSALAAEKAAQQVRYLSFSGKKQDDQEKENKRPANSGCQYSFIKFFSRRWMRNILLLASLAIFWKHYKQCRVLVKAYEINPLLHAPVFCFSLPLLLAYTIYATAAVPRG